jgi:hypothetical protein
VCAIGDLVHPRHLFATDRPMFRNLVLPILLAGVIAMPLSVFAGDDGFGLGTSEDRERHDERADKIREAYARKREIKLKLQYIKALEKYSVAEFKVVDKPVGEALKELQEVVRRQDVDGAGFNLAYNCSKDRLKTPITLAMRDVPLPDLLRYIGMQCELGFEYEEHAVVVKNVEDADVIDVKKLAAELME